MLSLAAQHWATLVADEAQQIKNAGTVQGAISNATAKLGLQSGLARLGAPSSGIKLGG